MKNSRAVFFDAPGFLSFEGKVHYMAKRGENIYKRRDGRWEARAVRGYDEDGKPVYAYFYGRTYKEAKDKMFMSLSFVDCSVSPVIKESTEAHCFGDLLDVWLENSKFRLKESSYVKYYNLIRRHIKPFLGGYTLSDITSTVIKNFVGKKLSTEANKAENCGLSGKTMRDILSIIKSTLNYAKDESLLRGFSINVALPKGKPECMRVLSPEEQAALEKHLYIDMDEGKLGVYLCLYTGIRLGEACALVWSDFSLEEGLLTVSRTMQRIQSLDPNSPYKTKIIITDPKSNFSIRKIPLPNCLIEKLMLLRPLDQSAYVLTGECERFLEPRAFQYRFKTYLSKSGVNDANFHSLRHTFATRCVALGFEIKSLSEILGHSNVNITLNRYVHPSFDMKRSNMNKLEPLH